MKLVSYPTALKAIAMSMALAFSGATFAAERTSVKTAKANSTKAVPTRCDGSVDNNCARILFGDQNGGGWYGTLHVQSFVPSIPSQCKPIVDSIHMCSSLSLDACTGNGPTVKVNNGNLKGGYCEYQVYWKSWGGGWPGAHRSFKVCIMFKSSKAGGMGQPTCQILEDKTVTCTGPKAAWDHYAGDCEN